MSSMRPQTPSEEVANVVTHSVGALLALAGGTILIVLAALAGDPWKVVGVSVFVGSLLALYVASTLYHAVRKEPLKTRFQVMDHAAIYLLIAGTYTPFTLDTLRGGWGWSLFGVIWGMAVLGVVFKLFFIDRFPRLSTAVYIGMGWLVVIGAAPVVRTLDPVVLAWLVAGGLAYTSGTLFFHSTRIPYAHTVWHLFVLTGSVCHGIAVGVQI